MEWDKICQVSQNLPEKRKRAAEKIGSSLGQLLAQELAGIVEVQHNFLDVILKLLIHSFIPPEK